MKRRERLHQFAKTQAVVGGSARVDWLVVGVTGAPLPAVVSVVDAVLASTTTAASATHMGELFGMIARLFTPSCSRPARLVIGWQAWREVREFSPLTRQRADRD